MKKVKVRCWELQDIRYENEPRECLLITYPEGNLGHKLVTCLGCGVVYAIDVTQEVYVGPPLSEKISTVKCVNCNCSLASNLADYPENYVSNDGSIRKFQRPTEIPPDGESLIKELWGIYD